MNNFIKKIENFALHTSVFCTFISITTVISLLLLMMFTCPAILLGLIMALALFGLLWSFAKDICTVKTSNKGKK